MSSASSLNELSDRVSQLADFPRITKYTTAGQALNTVLKKLVPEIQPGKKVLDLCVEGDKLVSEATASLYNKAKNGVKVPKGE